MKDNKLKTGYTTGTCAAAAAKAAAVFLLTGRRIEEVEVELPGGGFCRQRLEVAKADILEQKSCGWKAQRQVSGWFGVKKDAGDDPDVTHGTVIYAQAERLGEVLRAGGISGGVFNRRPGGWSGNQAGTFLSSRILCH